MNFMKEFKSIKNSQEFWAIVLVLGISSLVGVYEIGRMVGHYLGSIAPHK